MRFNPKISALEEILDMDSISMNELHGIFTAYEMRTEQENPNTKEAAFEASKNSKKKGRQKEEHSRNNGVLEDDEEVANFVKRLRKGTNGIYCYGIGHFVNKFPHKKKKRNEEYDSNRKQTYKGKITK
jgi:hypothetical protein